MQLQSTEAPCIELEPCSRFIYLQCYYYCDIYIGMFYIYIDTHTHIQYLSYVFCGVYPSASQLVCHGVYNSNECSHI